MVAQEERLQISINHVRSRVNKEKGKQEGRRRRQKRRVVVEAVDLSNMRENLGPKIIAVLAGHRTKANQPKNLW